MNPTNISLCLIFPAASLSKRRCFKCQTPSTGSRSIRAEKSFTSVAGRATTFTFTIGTEAAGPRAALALGNITPGAMGLAVTADGKRLVVANYENDSVSLVDIAGRVVLAEL